MSLTLLGWLLLTPLSWLLIASSIVIAALFILPLRSGGLQRGQPEPATSDAALEGIGGQPQSRKLDAGNATGLVVLSRLRSWVGGRNVGGTAGMRIVAGAGFLLVAGIGAATSYLRVSPEAIGSGHPISSSPSHSGPNGDMLMRLEDYTRSIGGDKTASTAAPGKLLPDVNTMMERLAARLETTPADIKGWGMLGWSYLRTGRYEQAAAAYAKALELDPSSAELKRSYEEAKAKASGSDGATASPSQGEAAGKAGDGPDAGKMAKSEAMPPHERGAEIRAMVDGLANRLESSPRDVDGWTRLMRSRVVLGERDVALKVFGKALDIFKDDLIASGKITAAAIELGLKAK
ncbi:MAG: tetratricopeptide repeat protein [Rhodospirillales bacterium]|nr:tetratricopeptide repeat protein [Rhodospirillales bacterium]